MPVVSSQYWNQVHGNTPEEVKQDLEGMQTMRTLGNNMAWLLKCIAAGKAAGVDFPEREPAQKTNLFDKETDELWQSGMDWEDIRRMRM